MAALRPRRNPAQRLGGAFHAGVGYMGSQIAEAVDAMAYEGQSPAEALAGIQARVQQEVQDKLAAA